MRTLAVIVSLLATALALAACGADERARPAGFAPAAAAAVRDVGARDAVLLDVRTKGEVAAGRARRAVHLPLAEIERGARPDVAKDARIYVYCRTGRRAAVAVRILHDSGFTRVTNIGGLRDWRRAGGGVE